MTQLAIFSDVHANLPAMEAIKSSIKSGSFDGVYCLRDLGGYASQPNIELAATQLMTAGLPEYFADYLRCGGTFS